MIAGVIGATGYAGLELTRILARHPRITELLAASSSAEGEQLEHIQPHLEKTISIKLTDAKTLINTADAVFSALPNGHGGELAKLAASRPVPFIDLSADFRFGTDEATYNAWYNLSYKGGELHAASVYGLPEMNRKKIAELGAARNSAPVVIANPGCYPTAVTLAAYPAVSLGLIEADGIIVADALSGISGAGRELGRAYHFAECADSASVYKVGTHRHTPEICRNLSRAVVFTPHLVPMNRGILATLYIPLEKKLKVTSNAAAPRLPTQEMEEHAAEIRKAYTTFYKDEHFIRVLPAGLLPATNRVRGSNYCDIAVNIAGNGETLIVTGAIDNMVKGAAGQAVQNMNIIFGFDETDGLALPPGLF